MNKNNINNEHFTFDKHFQFNNVNYNNIQVIIDHMRKHGEPQHYVYKAIDHIKRSIFPLNYENVSQGYLEQVPMDESNRNSKI